MNKIEIGPEFLRFDGHVFLKHVEKITIVSRKLRISSVSCYQASFTSTRASDSIGDLRVFNGLFEPTVIAIQK